MLEKWNKNYFTEKVVGRTRAWPRYVLGTLHHCYCIVWDMQFSWRWRRKFRSSGLWRRIVFRVIINVSEERAASTFEVQTATFSLNLEKLHSSLCLFLFSVSVFSFILLSFSYSLFFNPSFVPFSVTFFSFTRPSHPCRVPVALCPSERL
jgi:hypothetical protein